MKKGPARLSIPTDATVSFHQTRRSTTEDSGGRGEGEVEQDEVFEVQQCRGGSWDRKQWEGDMCSAGGVEVRVSTAASHWSCSGEMCIRGREAVHAAECRRLEKSNGCAGSSSEQDCTLSRERIKACKDRARPTFPTEPTTSNADCMTYSLN